MRVCVFVDGENLRHAIGDLFTQQQFHPRDYLPKGANWAELFDHLVDLATGGAGQRVRTYWYVVEQVDPYPAPMRRRDQGSDRDVEQWALRNNSLLRREGVLTGLNDSERLDRVRGLQRKLVQQRTRIQSRFDGFRTIQQGIARRHRAVEFRRSGGIGYNLLTGQLGQEKTVDVNLAVDLVQLSDWYDLALIVSGDQDYVPAVQAVKNRGKQTVNAAFRTRNGNLLPGGAARLNQQTDWSIDVAYEDLRQHLKLPALAPRGR